MLLGEVIHINKEAFLAELNKLLTFMYDSDKKVALSMYKKMFEEGISDDAVIQYLNSPTRQAVNIAHSYDAKERKAALDEEVNEGDDVPEFVDTIADIAEGLCAAHGKADFNTDEPRVLRNQISIFGDDEPDISPSSIDNMYIQEPYSPEPMVDEPFNITLDKPYTENIEIEKPVQNEVATPSIDLNDIPREEEPLPAPNYPKDSIFNDPFYAKAIANGAPVPDPEEENDDFFDIKPDLKDFSLDNIDEGKKEATPRKTIVPLLLLYILFAVPLTALAIVLLLVLAILFLGIAAGTIYLGSQALMAAFANFTVFADIMVVLGTALVIFALGLLFLWIAIWIIGGAIVGVVRSAIRIGEKFCTKEVQS